MNQHQSTKRPRRDAAQWQELVSQWRVSDLSAEAFSAKHDIGVDSLCKWKRRLRSTGDIDAPRLKLDMPSFSRIHVSQPREAPREQHGAEIEIALWNRVCVRVHGTVNQESLAVVLQTASRVQSC
jgi:hypothetical protein